MKIIDNYTSIVFHNPLEVKYFVDVFFNDYEIREKFINKRNYYKYLSEVQENNSPLYMANNDHRFLLRKFNKIMRKQKLLKINKHYG